MTEQEAKKLVEEHRKAGDLIDFCLKTRDESLENWNIILKNLKKDEVTKYGEKVPSHIKELIKQHKQNGDFDAWIKELEVHEKKQIPFCKYG